MITAQDRKRYRHMNDSAILSHKLIDSLKPKVLLALSKEYRKKKKPYTNAILVLLGSKTNTNWVAAKVIEEMYERKMIDEEKFYELIKIPGKFLTRANKMDSKITGYCDIDEIKKAINISWETPGATIEQHEYRFSTDAVSHIKKIDSFTTEIHFENGEAIKTPFTFSQLANVIFPIIENKSEDRKTFDENIAQMNEKHPELK